MKKNLKNPAQVYHNDSENKANKFEVLLLFLIQFHDFFGGLTHGFFLTVEAGSVGKV